MKENVVVEGRCPECQYDHEKEGPGAACLRRRTDEDLARECFRRWRVNPLLASSQINRVRTLALTPPGAPFEGMWRTALLEILGESPEPPKPRCGSCQGSGRWSNGLLCPVCTPPSGKRCTARESGGVQCELDAIHVEQGIQHACPEALRRLQHRQREQLWAFPKGGADSIQQTADSPESGSGERTLTSTQIRRELNELARSAGISCRTQMVEEVQDGLHEGTILESKVRALLFLLEADSPESGSGAVSCELSAVGSPQEESEAVEPATDERQP